MNRYAWALLLIFQACALTFAVFVEFGFDLPGQFGLSYGHFVSVVAMYALLLVGGVSVATMSREYRKILYQILIFLTICIVGVAYHLAVGPSLFGERPPDVQKQ